MIGNYLSVIGLIAHYNSVSFLKAFLFSNGGTIMSEMFKNAGIMDFIFWLIAGAEGFKFSVKNEINRRTSQGFLRNR